MQVSITVGIPEDVAKRLNELAENRGVSRNSLMREGIEHILEKYAPAP